MTQTQKTNSEASITLDSLRLRSAELGKGVASLQNNIQATEQQLTKFRNDLLSTAGAKQFVDQLLAQEDKKIADATAPAVEAPKAE